MSSPAIGGSRVTISPIDPAGPALVADLQGDDELSGGVGGWELLDRPRDVDATEWVNIPAFKIALPLVFNGFDTDTSVEADINRLIDLGRPIGSGAARRPPARLLLDGPLRIPWWNPAWVIADLTWGTQYRRDDRHRTYQEFTAVFTEHNAARIVRGPIAAARARAGL